jgi:hypothetical protein
MRLVQIELRRVGCLTAKAADSDWNMEAQRSLLAFNRKAGTNLDVMAATADTLDAIRQKRSRVCPPPCEYGYKADGDSCTKIVCAESSFLNEDSECVKRRGKTPIGMRDDRDHRGSRRERADRTPHEPPRPDDGAAPAGPQGAVIGLRIGTGRMQRYRLPSSEQELSSRIQGLLGEWSVHSGQ